MLVLMFTVTEDQTAVIRAAFEAGCEVAATIEFRRLFPVFANRADARTFALQIAGWSPVLPPHKPERPKRKHPGSR